MRARYRSNIIHSMTSARAPAVRSGEVHRHRCTRSAQRTHPACNKPASYFNSKASLFNRQKATLFGRFTCSRGDCVYKPFVTQSLCGRRWHRRQQVCLWLSCDLPHQVRNWRRQQPISLADLCRACALPHPAAGIWEHNWRRSSSRLLCGLVCPRRDSSCFLGLLSLRKTRQSSVAAA